MRFHKNSHSFREAALNPFRKKVFKFSDMTISFCAHLLCSLGFYYPLNTWQVASPTIFCFLAISCRLSQL